MNEIETLKVLNFLKRAYPHIERDRTFTEIQEMFEVYCEGLDDLNPTVLKVASRQLIREVKWFPSVAELAERVHSIVEQAQRSNGSATPTAAEAWRQIAQALHPAGYGFEWDTDRKVRLQPIVIKAAELFGELRFALRMEEDAGTDFAQFRGIYEALQKRAQDDARLMPATRQVIKELADKLDMGKRLLAGGDKRKAAQ